MLDKFKDFMGLNEEDYSDYDETDADAYRGEFLQPEPPIVQPVEEERQIPRAANVNRHSNKVVGMPGIMNGVSEMILIEPRSFEEMPQVIDALRQRKSVILNMTLIKQEEAQRSVDFVAGGTYAIDGHYERIGDNIFLFTPNCVQVSTQAHNNTEITSQPPQTNPAARTTTTTRERGVAPWGSEPLQIAQ